MCWDLLKEEKDLTLEEKMWKNIFNIIDKQIRESQAKGISKHLDDLRDLYQIQHKNAEQMSGKDLPKLIIPQ